MKSFDSNNEIVNTVDYLHALNANFCHNTVLGCPHILACGKGDKKQTYSYIIHK